MNPSQPEPVAGEHNPDGLTPEQYGAPEWRLLSMNDELIDGDEGDASDNGTDWIPHGTPRGTVVAQVNMCAYRRRVTPAQTGEQTPESAEVKACPSEWIVEPMTEKVAAGLFRDGELVAVGNGEVSNSVFRKIADMMNAESSSLASLQAENERLREELRNEIADKRTVEGFYKSAGDEAEQLRAEVERLTKERDAAVAFQIETAQQRNQFMVIAQNLEAQLAEREEDRKDLDWLELQVVSVRAPMRYGSRPLFIASPEEDECEGDKPSTIRAAIRSARGATPEGTTQDNSRGAL